MKLFKRFRARWILPIRWAFAKDKKAGLLLMPLERQILERLEQEKEELVNAQVSESSDQVRFREGSISILEWIIAYGKTK